MKRRWAPAAAVFAIALAGAALPQADDAAPQLIEADLHPTFVDVRNGPADVTVRLHLTDDLSGVRDWVVFFASPSEAQTVSAEGHPALVSGTPTDGWFAAELTVPRHAEGGRWRLLYWSAKDAAGNACTVFVPKPAKLGFEVLSEPSPAEVLRKLADPDAFLP